MQLVLVMASYFVVTQSALTVTVREMTNQSAIIRGTSSGTAKANSRSTSWSANAIPSTRSTKA